MTLGPDALIWRAQLCEIPPVSIPVKQGVDTYRRSLKLYPARLAPDANRTFVYIFVRGPDFLDAVN